MSRTLRLTFCVTALLASACEKDNSEYCDGHPDDVASCPPPDAGACTTDDQCGGEICDTTNGTCVTCTPARPDACTATTPVCSTDNECTACTSHDQCSASNVCLPTGACGTEAQTAYVSATGTDNTTCSLAMPCTKIASALATSRPTIKVTGTINEQVTLNNRNVTFLAAPGAKLTDISNGILLRVDGTSVVAIYDLEISGGSGATNPAISMQPGNAGSLALTRVKIIGNSGLGISASGGSLAVNQSTISENGGGGISVSGVATVNIVNNFIFRNGDPDNASVGGVSLSSSTTAASHFEFNTIVDNRSKPGTLQSGGVVCAIVGFTAPNNVIARNALGIVTNAANSQTLGDCTYPTSKVQADVTGLALLSVEMAPFNYRIGAGSTAIDAATTTSSNVIDVDGQTRPQGAAKDCGADEYAP